MAAFFSCGARGDELCVRMRLNSFGGDADHAAQDAGSGASATGRPRPAVRNRPPATARPQTDTRGA
ncbi:hypothetical protein WT27_06315 [Burkholderia territorii]|uniref:Uncharacterized protein n=1 Tax=Burkholderia territorii TaxID=1503055 RepID=A0A119AT37_9BURK|nr:hypothetical protein WT27_06315 [Burkholderia territorii]